MTGMFVIVEWNQASHQPSLASDEVYTSREEAEESAQPMRDEAASVGRREEFTVHELGEELRA